MWGQAAQSLKEVLQGVSREAGEGGTSSKTAWGDSPKPRVAPRHRQEEVRGELSSGPGWVRPWPTCPRDYPQPWPWPSSCDRRGESCPHPLPDFLTDPSRSGWAVGVVRGCPSCLLVSVHQTQAPALDFVVCSENSKAQSGEWLRWGQWPQDEWAAES